MITKTCEYCGKEFKTYPSRNSKFCSKECHYASKRGEPIPWLDDIRKPGVCLNSGRTHFKKGEHASSETEFEKGHEPWNRDKEDIYSEETLEKMRESHKGQRFSKETEFEKGHEPWNKNKKNIHLNPESEFRKNDPRITGENNVNWKGGITDEYHKIKQSKEYKEWRASVYERDHFTCQKCGKSENIVAHHLEDFASNPDKRFDVNNGVTLCRSCHAKFHHQYGFGDNTREQWKDFHD